MTERQALILAAILAATAVACGGGSTGDMAPDAGAAAPPDAATSTSGGLTRASLVLCDALEPHREELATIVGFEQDPDRALAIMRSECAVRGAGGAFARVQLLPAIIPSIAMHVQGFDGEASLAPELGADAMFVDDGLQPHVIFAMGPLFIDVNAENVETPSRETMIRLAERVREILAAANS